MRLYVNKYDFYKNRLVFCSNVDVVEGADGGLQIMFTSY